MRTIWKFRIEPGRGTVEMPKGAVVVSVQSQDNRPAIWALCDAAAPKESRTFRVFATGEPFELAGLEYLGTFHLDAGALVFHVFEEVHE